MAHFMPPPLLALFAPRPPPEWRPPIEKKPAPRFTGIAHLVDEFIPPDQLPPVEKTETPRERKARIKKEKAEAHKLVLEQRAKEWNPHDNTNATKDAYKTLFVARLSYEVTEDDLRDEFERYGPIRDIKLVRNKESGKSRGYAFIEFESSQDLKDAFQTADGQRIKGRRIIVDVERGRTVPGWKPRKLGGGLGTTRAPKPDRTRVEREPDDYRNRRERYQDRDRRDQHRSERRPRRSRSRDRNRDRDHNNNKYRREDYDRNRRDRDRDRDRERRKDRDRNRSRSRGRGDRDHRDRGRDRDYRRHDRDRRDYDRHDRYHDRNNRDNRDRYR